jgi:hypothetical protein
MCYDHEAHLRALWSPDPAPGETRKMTESPTENEKKLADLILQDTSIIAYGRVKGLSKALALVAAERVDRATAAAIIALLKEEQRLRENRAELSKGLSCEAQNGLQILATGLDIE